MQVIDTGSIIPATKIECRYFIVKDQYQVVVKIKSILFQFVFNVRNQREAFFKCSMHKMLVDLCGIQINKGLYFEVFVMIGNWSFCKFFKAPQRICKPSVIAKIKMRIQNIVHAFYVMPRLNR